MTTGSIEGCTFKKKDINNYLSLHGRQGYNRDGLNIASWVYYIVIDSIE